MSIFYLLILKILRSLVKYFPSFILPFLSILFKNLHIPISQLLLSLPLYFTLLSFFIPIGQSCNDTVVLSRSDELSLQCAGFHRPTNTN